MINSSQIDMSELLQLVVDEGASDLHLEVGVPPVLRIHGRMQPIDATPLMAEDTERFMKSITSEDHQQKIREGGGTDFGFSFGSAARFRVSVLKAKGCVGIVLRQIPSKLMSLEGIGLPPQVKELLFRPRGLILVTGPTGSGKTTTLASMVNLINEERDAHIITVEDPVEYYHSHKKSVVTQREIGVDVPSFSEALRRALRQDPDVILVGEMRDLETIQLAITAAETGHLVFGTLHTSSASQTVDRMVDVFPPSQQTQIRVQLSGSLLAVFSQTLCQRHNPPAGSFGRVMAQEIMINTPAIANLIREGKTAQLYSQLQTGGQYGMQTLEKALANLIKAGAISKEEGLAKAGKPDELTRLVGDN